MRMFAVRFWPFMVAMSLAACQQASAPRPGQPAMETPATIEVFDYFAGKRTVSPDWAKINSQPVGSQGNPVRVYLPPGEYAYLARLVCADGTKPTYFRVGNYGFGPYTTIIDGFEVTCSGTKTMIFADMYHPSHVERRVPAGFTLSGGR